MTATCRVSVEAATEAAFVAGMPEALVDVLLELQPGRRLVQLGHGRAEHRGVEVGFLSHQRPFR